MTDIKKLEADADYYKRAMEVIKNDLIKELSEKSVITEGLGDWIDKAFKKLKSHEQYLRYQNKRDDILAKQREYYQRNKEAC